MDSGALVFKPKRAPQYDCNLGQAYIGYYGQIWFINPSEWKKLKRKNMKTLKKKAGRPKLKKGVKVKTRNKKTILNLLAELLSNTTLAMIRGNEDIVINLKRISKEIYELRLAIESISKQITPKSPPMEEPKAEEPPSP